MYSVNLDKNFKCERERAEGSWFMVRTEKCHILDTAGIAVTNIGRYKGLLTPHSMVESFQMCFLCGWNFYQQARKRHPSFVNCHLKVWMGIFLQPEGFPDRGIKGGAKTVTGAWADREASWVSSRWQRLWKYNLPLHGHAWRKGHPPEGRNADSTMMRDAPYVLV